MIAALVMLSAVGAMPQGQPGDSLVVLHGGHYVDVRAGALRPNGTIVVRGAHAIGRAGALLAAAQGVRALAHTPVVDSAAAATLAGTGIRVISTLASLGPRPGGAEVRRSFGLLLEVGVPVVLGTDAGVLAHGKNAEELVALDEAGLTPAEALRAATVAAAALLGVDEIGEIAIGKAADFVVVEGDPLTDLRVVQRPVMVLKGGRPIR